MFKGNFLLVLFLYLLSIFPLRFLHFLAHFFGFFLNIVPNNLKKVTKINLTMCFPQKTQKEINLLTNKSLKETLKIFLNLGSVGLLIHKGVLIKH